MGDKQAAKLRRREAKEQREKEKAERVGQSPAQEAEAIRRQNDPDPADESRRDGMDGFMGGDTVHPDLRKT